MEQEEEIEEGKWKEMNKKKGKQLIEGDRVSFNPAPPAIEALAGPGGHN